MRGLQGKRIVIAGGATGIGAAAADRLAAEGDTVAVGDISFPAAQDTARRITAAGGTAIAIEFDLADEKSVQALADLAVAGLGGVDGLYNVGADLSASTLGGDADLMGMDPAAWRRTLELNLLGYALTCRAVIPLLLGQGGGVIVNTCAGASFGGEPTHPASAASKAGINALTRHIASHYGKEGIRCNGVMPDLVIGQTQRKQGDTELQAKAPQYARSPRLGEPADLAAAVAFMFSDDAAWISGQVWSVDGLRRRCRDCELPPLPSEMET